MADPISAGLVFAGMSAGTAATVGTVASAAMTGFSLLQGVRSGYEQEAAYQTQAYGVEEQAQMEKLRAQEEGNLRRERLLNALAAQNVRSGASGVMGGTQEALQLKSMEDYQRDQSQADLMSQTTLTGMQRQRESLKLQGKSARKGAIAGSLMQLASVGYSPGAKASGSATSTFMKNNPSYASVMGK